MAKVYRLMKRDGEGPMVGSGFAMLGARVPQDIEPDDDDNVHPGAAGMSVLASLRSLPARLVPARLRALVPGAAGSNNRVVWSHGEGAFEVCPFAPGLMLLPDETPGHESHGFVAPAARMPLDEYQRALAVTRAGWKQDEE